jgi:AraC-like DNA-binding protein
VGLHSFATTFKHDTGMTPYSSTSGKKSGVTAYSLGHDFIIVEFENFKRYKYSYRTAGKRVVDHMKALALASEGLSTFIAQNEPGFEQL